jgi:hypothetical protein
MPIENPIISPIGGPVGQAEPLRIDTQSMDRAISTVGEAVKNVKVERLTRDFKAELDQEESAYMEELYGLMKERDTVEVLQAENSVDESVTSNPQVKEMLSRLRVEDTAASQGIIDSNRLGVRKELIFREYAAKYPRLIPEFLKVSSASGLGGTSSLQTQEMVDYLNEGAVARQREIEASAAKSSEYLKELEKNSRKLGLEPPPPGSSEEAMAGWLERYVGMASQHEKYMVETKAHTLWANQKERNVETMLEHTNQLVVTHGATFSGEVNGIIQNSAAQLFGVTDITQLTQAMQSGDLERLSLTVRQQAAEWKRNKMIELGGLTEAGKYITQSQWNNIFAAADQQVEAALAMIGTGPTMDKIKNLEAASKAQWTAKLPTNLRYTNELAATLSATNQGISNKLNEQTANQLTKLAESSLLPEIAGAQTGNVTGERRPLMDATGTPTPIGGWNAMNAANVNPALKTQVEKDKFVAGYLEGTDALIRSNGKGLPEGTDANVVLTGAMSQVVSTFDTVADKVAAENKAGRVYLPEDSLMANLVSSASSDEFGEQFQSLSPRDQNIARASMKTVLDFETAYIANVLNKSLNAYSTQARGDNRQLTGTMSGLAAAYGNPGGFAQEPSLSEYAGEGELFVMTVNNDTGDIAFSISNDIAAKLSPRQKLEAEREIRLLTMEKSARISNALKAQVQIGNYPSYEDALLAATMVEGWPSHLSLGATAAKSEESIGMDDIEATQKKTRGEE